jgi:hypothetical protein
MGDWGREKKLIPALPAEEHFTAEYAEVAEKGGKDLVPP